MEHIQKIEHNGITVLTTQQIADAYETNTDTITKNFNRNKERYTEGKHYICLKGDELKEFRANGQIDLSPNTHTFYLWTKKGAFLHAKSLNTDNAWELYDALVDNYFDKQNREIDTSKLSPELQMFYVIADAQAKMELATKRLTLEVENVKKNQDFIKETFATSADTENFKTWVNRCVGLIAESPEFTKGTTRTLKYTNARTESYERLKKKRNCNLNDRVQRAKGRAIQKKPSISKAELNAINKLSVIADDKDLRVAYESVIREMMLFYCVAEKAEV